MKKLILFSMISLLGLSSSAEVFAMEEWKRQWEKQERKNEALESAINNKNLTAVKKAVEDGAQIRTINLIRATFLAAKNIVEYFIERGMDINTLYDNFPYSAIHSAAKKGNFDMIKFLLSKGANINLEADDFVFKKVTPLEMVAINKADFKILKFLVKHGAKITERTLNELNPEQIKKLEIIEKRAKKAPYAQQDSTERQEFLYKKSKKKKEKILKPFIIKIDGKEVAVPGKGFLQ